MLSLKDHALDILLPWKCASQTVRTRLRPYAQEPYQQLFYFNNHLQRVRNQHHTFADYLLLPQSKQGHEVATFVRNPYDRVVSGFMQLCRDSRVIPQLQFDDQNLKHYVLDQVAQNTQDLIRSSYNLNVWFLNLSIYKILDNSSATFLLQPAHVWTHCADKKIDFIGKVETFEADFERLKLSYRIGTTVMESVNQSQIKSTAGPNAYYRHAQQLNSRSISRINDIFSLDFDLFGYKKITV